MRGVTSSERCAVHSYGSPTARAEDRRQDERRGDVGGERELSQESPRSQIRDSRYAIPAWDASLI